MNTTIGKKLKTLRKKQGLSQEKVAEKLSISQSTYARLEKGEGHSWARYINQICVVFEITPEELINENSN